MTDEQKVAGHAFLSYVREDAQAVNRLQGVLEAAGIRVWRDTADLWPGEDWRLRIRRAITGNALAFIACFSQNSVGREKSYQNEELVLAIEQLRQRRPDDSWLIPVRLDDCVIPDWDVGGGRTLASIQRADLFGERDREGVARLVATVLRILGRRSDVAASAQGLPAVVPGAVAPSGTPDVAAVANEEYGTTPAITDRWKLTHTTRDVPAMAQLGSQGFGHRAYGRPAEQTPPWVQIRAVVACDPLGDSPGWQDLRGRFAGLLSQESIRGLISELTDIPDGAVWRPRGTHRRSWLEADLAVEDETVVPAASAALFLPDGESQAGLPGECAQITLHIDFVPRTPISISGQVAFRRPPYWRERFAQALALPGELADWLENQLGLATSSLPPAQSGIMLQARQPLPEIIDTSGIRAMSSSNVVNQFTGWAVADAQGKNIQELASEMMLDLSERVLHLDGDVKQMSGLA